MSAIVLRQRYNREFAKLNRYPGFVAWGIVLAYIAQAGLAVIFGGWLLSQDTSIATNFGVLVVMLFIATRMRGLNNIIHECSHATFALDRAQNYLVGKFCGAILFLSFVDYRDEHLTHHAHLGDYEKDMDLHGIEDMGIHDPLTRAVLFRHIVTPFIGRHLPYYLSFDLSAKDGRAFQMFKFALIALALTALVFFPLGTALFVAVPYFFLSPTLNYWADCIDHAGLVAEEDDLDASRNVRVPSPVQALFFPRNDNYHLVHHLFPSIPARHLDQAHKALLDDQLYSQRSNATGSREPASVKDLATVK